MLLAQITAVDYVILAFYLVLMILIGGYFSRQQKDSRDFFLAGRSMGWLPVGLSVMATLLSALSYTGVPSESYNVGLKMVYYWLPIWLTLPIMLGLAIPLFRRLELYSVYEYLEMRFSLAVRLTGSAVFVVWRLLWLGGVLFAPCKVVGVALDLSAMQISLLIVVLGAVGTFYTYLGGMKAVIWTDVIQTIVMAAGLVLIVGAVWTHLDGGSARVREIAQKLHRTDLFGLGDANTSDGGNRLLVDEAPRAEPKPTESFWSQKWTFWAMVPHMFFAFLSFYIADQITAQRFLTTVDLSAAKRSYLLNCVSVSLMMLALMYVGLALLAFYHDHPEQMKLYWVVNATKEVDQAGGGQDEGELLKDSQGQPYITAQTDIRAELDRLVAAGAILDPNKLEPLASSNQLLDPLSGELDIDRLATRDPVSGERVLRRGADELLPHFIGTQLVTGVAGLIFAALLAASMSSMDSGLNSISTLLISDIYRRLGAGQASVARLRGKPPAALDGTDELWLGRRLVLLMGVGATLFSLWVSQLENIFTIMISVCNTFGAPLLAVFLLGIFTRRTTSPAALAALVAGVPLTLWLAFGYRWGLWPWETELASVWAVTFGTLLTMAVGYLLSFAVGTTKSRAELRGLAWGHGPLGGRPALDVADDAGEDRWA
jgi:Na+/proline symporter